MMVPMLVDVIFVDAGINGGTGLPSRGGLANWMTAQRRIVLSGVLENGRR
jgi:hypothetical protein